MKVLITGCAGFIGMHVTLCLLRKNMNVVGLDNYNDYYDVTLKKARIRNIRNIYKNFICNEINIENNQILNKFFDKNKFDVVIHLAAQAGVRYSLKNPETYVNSNLVGFVNILEMCRRYDIKHLLYASSSSVYGGNSEVPFSESDNVDHPISLYAATKKSNEVLAHSYSHLFKFPSTGMRFFTVYGPWGRPDMAYFCFVKKILSGEPITVFGNGNMYRDFTYIDDVSQTILKLIDLPPKQNNNFKKNIKNISESNAPWRIVNIGNENPVKLNYFIKVIEKHLNLKAVKIYKEVPPGDVIKTYADLDKISKLLK